MVFVENMSLFVDNSSHTKCIQLNLRICSVIFIVRDGHSPQALIPVIFQ